MNVSSTAATRPGSGLTAYSAAKAGVVQMTRSLALEIEGTGVTAVAYDPGPMDTEMQERLRRAVGEDFARADEFQQMQREGRLRDPKQAARDIAYLVLPATQRNGQALEWSDQDFARAVKAALPA
jgi:benzil reductase ((S)-benzoin forming)